MSGADALLELLEILEAERYDFTAPTPATHSRVVARRAAARPGNLRDVFGWSLPFVSLEARLFDCLERANAVEPAPDGRRRSKVRVSRLHGRLFVHSAFPTEDEDSVFLGPDSYRFADFILREIGSEVRGLVDVGAGAGVGAIVAAGAAPNARVALTDVNRKALAFAEVNARHAGLAAELIETEGQDGVAGEFALVLANPPYMADGKGRDYRDGGGGLGAQASIDWARQALKRLPVGGRILLYSGSAIVDGRDGLKAALEAMPEAAVRYSEIDPDVFGEELEKPPYARVERIAAIGAVITRL